MLDQRNSVASTMHVAPSASTHQQLSASTRCHTSTHEQVQACASNCQHAYTNTTPALAS
jgi:hypothetical protein